MRWEVRLSIPFFMGIWGELDHWYHSLCLYNKGFLAALQDGMLNEKMGLKSVENTRK